MAASDSVAPKLFAGSRTAANVRRPTISREKFQRILGIAETFADLVTCGLSMFFACLSVRGILAKMHFPVAPNSCGSKYRIWHGWRIPDEIRQSPFRQQNVSPGSERQSVFSAPQC